VSGKLLGAALATFAGAAAYTACLLALVGGMENVVGTDGGFCASGGPYVIAHQCSNADVRLIIIGIFGALIAAVLYAGGTSGLGSRAASAGLVLWAALFGTLGWTFVSASDHSGLFTGVLFLAMAAGGVLRLLVLLARDLRRPSLPDPLITGMQPLVHASVPQFPGMQPGMTAGYQPTAAPLTGTLPVPGPANRAASRSTELLRTGAWLVASVAGTAAGIALSSSLISVLR
jgi:hypothetical protein